jgi:hypothetical protein
MRKSVRGFDGGGHRFTSAVLAGVLVAAAMLALVSPAAAVVETTFELRPAPARPEAPPLPPTSTFPVQLVLDDDQQDAVFGVSGAGGARQFLWFNRFTRPLGVDLFRLQQIWVLFPSGANMSAGSTVQLVVYLDPDGNPANGATFLASYTETIQVVDDVTFSVYTVPAGGLLISGPGDVLIGVVNRFVTSGVTPPTSPASLDLSASDGRSWFATWTGDPPNPPLLPPDQLITRIDDFNPQAAGDWMIRGFGTLPGIAEVPAVSPWGLVFLALLLSAAAAVVLRRRTHWAGRTSGGRS